MSKHIKTIAPILLILEITLLYPAANVTDPRYSAYYRFGVCIYVLLSLYLMRVNIWIGMFAILAGFSSMYPFNTKYSMDSLIAISIGLAWYYLVAQSDKYVQFLNAICVIAILNAVMLVSQYLGFDPIFKPADGGAGHPTVGLMSNKNEASAMLAICLPAMFRKKWHYFVPLVFLGLFIASSTGGVLAATLSVLCYFVLKDKSKFIKANWIGLAVLALFLAVFFFYRDPPVQHSAETGNITIAASANERLAVWWLGFKMFSKHPLFGAGLGHWKVVFSKIKIGTTWWKHAHNDFLQAIFEMGIGFLVLFGLYLFRIIKGYKKEMILSVSALVAICANAGVNFPFHIAQTAMVAIAWLGIIQMQQKPMENQNE